MFRFIRNGVIGVVILLLTLGTIVLVSHEGRVAIRTGFIVADALTEGGRPAPPLTSEPLVETVSYPYVGGTARGTLHRPQAGGRHGAVIFVLGINPDLNDALLQRFARLLARQGVVVLVAEPVHLQDGQITPQEVEGLIGAFQFLRAAPYVEPKRVGYAGFCVGASLSLIAAADPRISSDVKFVNFFGGYFSGKDLVAAMTTRQVALDGTRAPWEPNDTALAWMAAQLIDGLDDPAARPVLERAVTGGGASAAELDGLSLGARSVYNVLVNRDPARAAEVYARLPLGLRERLDALSPEHRLDWLQTKVYIMHDRQDTYVPYTESRHLFAALAAYPRKHFTEFGIFQHMLPNRPVDQQEFLGEAWKLFGHLYLLMLEIS